MQACRLLRPWLGAFWLSWREGYADADLMDKRPSEEHVHHPPNEKQRYHTKDDMGDPVASRFRFPEVEHGAMVASEGS